MTITLNSKSSSYYYRRKRLSFWVQKLNEAMAAEMKECENYFIVDPMPIPICKTPEKKGLKLVGKSLKLLLTKDFQRQITATL